jgi:hypothetical protein
LHSNAESYTAWHDKFITLFLRCVPSFSGTSFKNRILYIFILKEIRNKNPVTHVLVRSKFNLIAQYPKILKTDVHCQGGER